MTASQMLIKLMEALAQRQLPADYSIALWFDSKGYSTQLLDPDGTHIHGESPQDFGTLCEIAQADAKRRASHGVH